MDFDMSTKDTLKENSRYGANYCYGGLNFPAASKRFNNFVVFD